MFVTLEHLTGKRRWRKVAYGTNMEITNLVCTRSAGLLTCTQKRGPCFLPYLPPSARTFMWNCSTMFVTLEHLTGKRRCRIFVRVLPSFCYQLFSNLSSSLGLNKIILN